MIQQYSVAEARSKLTRLLRSVEHGEPIEIPRRGKRIAVVLALADYQRLTTGRLGFRKAYDAFLRAVPAQDREVGQEYFRGLRDRSPGREVEI